MSLGSLRTAELEPPQYSPVLIHGKAATLERIAPLLTKGRVLPMYRFSTHRWRADSDAILNAVFERLGGDPLIVRSSASFEDGAVNSRAGTYPSVANVRGRDGLLAAIQRVVSSYGSSDEDEVFVQPMAQGVNACGVAMTRDPESGRPYYVVNYTIGPSTDAVTSGSAAVRTFACVKAAHVSEPKVLRGLLDLLFEVERITSRDDLDVEFACTDVGVLLLQVRQMTGRSREAQRRQGDSTFRKTVSRESRELADLVHACAPAAADRWALFGLMPDWNPAEMIGVKPRPLAYSLYRELITDVNWASARFRYGYRDLRHRKLMVQLCGSPYIAIPWSVESFIPASVPDDVARTVVDSCCRLLAEQQHLHDKIEFAVVPTCFTPAVAQGHGVDSILDNLSKSQAGLYLHELRVLTNKILSDEGPLFSDLSRLASVEKSFLSFRESAFHGDNKQYFRRALSEAKIVGELFSGVARSAFIATAILKSLERIDQIGSTTVDSILGSANTVGRRLSEDFTLLSKSSFLSKHGHIRPGTYDIRVPRYDESPDSYFDWSARKQAPDGSGYRINAPDSSVMVRIDRELDTAGLDITAHRLVEFAVASVAAREKAKYLYGGFVSEALKGLCSWGETLGFSKEDLSFIPVSEFLSPDKRRLAERLQGELHKNRTTWLQKVDIRVPHIICGRDDLLAHDCHECTPNFVTGRAAEGAVLVLSERLNECSTLDGHIVLIESADPGFDWIFTRRISALITAYGGENSHMSIRAREFGIPAAIGVGSTRFRQLASARHLRLECAERRIQVVS